MSAEQKSVAQIVALPLRYDVTTGNVYNAENVVLARFRHRSQAEAVVAACNSHAALVAFVERYIREDEAAIAEWERQFPKMKWGKDDRAIKNLEAARELLKAAKGET